MGHRSPQKKSPPVPRGGALDGKGDSRLAEPYAREEINGILHDVALGIEVGENIGTSD